jgi:hypothetical protein
MGSRMTNSWLLTKSSNDGISDSRRKSKSVAMPKWGALEGEIVAHSGFISLISTEVSEIACTSKRPL